MGSGDAYFPVRRLPDAAERMTPAAVALAIVALVIVAAIALGLAGARGRIWALTQRVALRDLVRHDYLMAIGLRGAPTAPVKGRGAATS